MSTKHTAHHDGHTWKRTSAGRVYAFAVISKYNFEAVIKREEQDAREYFRNYRAYYESVASGAEAAKAIAKGYTWYTAEYTSKEQAKAAAYLALGEDGHAKKAADRFSDRSKFLVSSDGAHFYTSDASWCSRLDLAQKNASSGFQPEGVSKIVLPAVVK